MEAVTNRVISIVYELRKNGSDGEIVESLDQSGPLTFLFGRGNLLPKFEEHLQGLKTGDRFDFLLACDDAYGQVQENAIVDVPVHVFEVDGKIDNNLLQVGNQIPMMDREGRRLTGSVSEIHEDTVTMDFNHPMAGLDLYFTGEVSDIREATEDEIEHGHIHSEGSCEGCTDENCHSKNNQTGEHEHEHHHHHQHSH